MISFDCSALIFGNLYFLVYIRYNTAFDYIIVGGSTSGSVLAYRLSEDNCVKVLVIEARGDFQMEDAVCIYLLTA